MLRTCIAALLALFFAINAWAVTDANQASRAELETVKGIGPGLSGKILDARKAGPFKDWADLVDRVGGIGAGNAARLSQAGLTVGGASFDGKAVPQKAAKSEKTAKADKTERTEKSEKAPKKAKKSDQPAA